MIRQGLTIAADDLNAPLGQHKAPMRQQAPPIPQMIAGLLSAIVIVFAAWAMLADDPFGGEPITVVAIEAAPSKPPPDVTASPASQAKTDAAPGDALLSTNSVTAVKAVPPASRTITIIDGSSGKREEVVIPASPVRGR
jgi:hypothetical protein